MKSTVVASIEFYYQGEKFTPSATLDLDELMQKHGQLPDLSLLLARANDISEYSYQLEVMLVEPILFDRAEGLVAAYINDHVLDIKAFEAAWHEQHLSGLMQELASRVMQVEDIERQPGLKQALLEAYHLGKTAGQQGIAS